MIVSLLAPLTYLGIGLIVTLNVPSEDEVGAGADEVVVVMAVGTPVVEVGATVVDGIAVVE